MSKSGDVNAQNLNRVTLCTRCGYALQGLPSRGRCPECGREYSPDVLVLYGRGRGGKKTLTAPGALMMLLYALAIAAFIATDQIFDRKYASMLHPTLAVLIFGGFICRRYMLRKQMPAESQLHLSSAGFGFRDGLGDVTMTSWQAADRVLIRAIPLNLYRLQVKARPMQFVADHPLDFTFEAEEVVAIRIAERIEQYRNGLKVERDFPLKELV
jgi:hypothetical protein